VASGLGSRRATRLVNRVAAVSLLLLSLASCSRDAWQRSPGPDDVIGLVPWFAVMKTGPAIQPFKMLREPVDGTVPIDGYEPPLFVIPDNFDEIDRLTNPAQSTAESLETGKKYYDIYCLPCHGEVGAGDGPINAKLYIAPSLLLDRAQDLSDGMIYSIIRHGRGAMRSYAEGVRGIDRWHVVNYVRQLQGAER
jgi:mono/diheme cytochrome c family protein